MAVVSGKYGYATIDFGASVLQFDVTDWTATPAMDAVDVTNTNAMTVLGTWEDTVASIYKSDFTFSGPVTEELFNLGFSPTFSGIYARVELGYIIQGVPRVVHNDQVLITSMKQTVNVKGFWQYEASGTSSCYTNL
jgi:hypothetical protein